MKLEFFRPRPPLGISLGENDNRFGDQMGGFEGLDLIEATHETVRCVMIQEKGTESMLVITAFGEVLGVAEDICPVEITNAAASLVQVHGPLLTDQLRQKVSEQFGRNQEEQGV